MLKLLLIFFVNELNASAAYKMAKTEQTFWPTQYKGGHIIWYISHLLFLLQSFLKTNMTAIKFMLMNIYICIFNNHLVVEWISQYIMVNYKKNKFNNPNNFWNFLVFIDLFSIFISQHFCFVCFWPNFIFFLNLSNKEKYENLMKITAHCCIFGTKYKVIPIF